MTISNDIFDCFGSSDTISIQFRLFRFTNQKRAEPFILYLNCYVLGSLKIVANNYYDNPLNMDIVFVGFMGCLLQTSQLLMQG